MHQTLLEQINSRVSSEHDEEGRSRKEEREALEELWETVRCEELARLEAERKRRETRKRELEEQLTAHRCLMMQREREETELDRQLMASQRDERTREESAAREAAADLQRETLAYMEYIRGQRLAERERDEQLERMFRECAGEQGFWRCKRNDKR